MAHTRETPLVAVFEIPEPKIGGLSPMAMRAVGELLSFYTRDQPTVDRFGAVAQVGFLELAFPWIMHGNALEILDRYESYVVVLGELVEAFGGTMSDTLVTAPPREQSIFVMMLAGSSPPVPTKELHPVLRRGTYEAAWRHRHQVDYELT